MTKQEFNTVDNSWNKLSLKFEILFTLKDISLHTDVLKYLNCIENKLGERHVLNIFETMVLNF